MPPTDSHPLAATDTGSRLEVNPIKNIYMGARTAFATNGSALLCALAANLAAGFVLSWLGERLLTSPGGGTMGFIFTLAVFLFLTAGLAALFYGVTARLLLTGVRQQKVSLTLAIQFVIKRLGRMVQFFVFVATVLIGLVIIVLLSVTLKVPLITFLLAFAASVVGVIFMLRVAYVPYILMDDAEPPTLPALVKQSTTLWQASFGAMLLFGVTAFVVSLIMSSITGKLVNQPAPDYQGTFINAGQSASFVSQNLPSAITAVVAVTLSAGFVKIYNDSNGQPAPPAAKVSTTEPNRPDSSAPTLPH
jgi:hypothetical protein